MTKRHLEFLIGLALMIIIGASCSTSNKLIPVAKIPVDQVLAGIEGRIIDYEHFSARARIRYNGEESKAGGRSNIRMIRDSLIWMNFKKLSVEGVRTLIRSDSCWVLYRFDDIYESGTTQEFLDYYKIYLPFGRLQDLLVGNFVVPESSQILDYKTGEYYDLAFYSGVDYYEYRVNGDFSMSRVLIRDAYDREMIISLSDYGTDNFAYRKELEIKLPGEGASIISLKLSSVEFDVPKTIKFEIPDHYRRLP